MSAKRQYWFVPSYLIRQAQADALDEYAAALDWARPAKSPCVDTESCCGDESSCDAMQPSVKLVGAANLRDRAATIRGGRHL